MFIMMKLYLEIMNYPKMEKESCRILDLNIEGCFLLSIGPSAMDNSPWKEQTHDTLQSSLRDFIGSCSEFKHVLSRD